MIRMTKLTWTVTVAFAAAITSVVSAWADAPAASPTDADKPAASQDVPSAAPDADRIMQDLLQKRQQAPAIPPNTARPTPSTAPAYGAVLGTAPDLKQAPLRREGEFVTQRRARAMRAADGAHLLLVFDADDARSPETPMILVPCQITQRLEDLVQERGERLVFVASGQVLVYRGANYLLPTVVKEAFDQGNLQP